MDHVPCNDFSFYEHVLDAAIATGIVPPRYRGVADPLARMFAMARGLLETDQVFRLDATKILGEVAESRALGIGSAGRRLRRAAGPRRSAA